MQSATLTVSGEGEMYVYDSYKDFPWYDYKPEIRNLILNEGMTTITKNAFSGLVKITEVNLPSTLKTIGNSAFSKCESLETLVIPNNITEIGQNTFQGCSNLDSVVIGNGIKTIDIFTFARCTSLTNITFPESLEKICSQAFSGCSSLENIQLPDKAINIESDCFIGTAFFTNPDNWEDGTLYLDNFLITGTRYTQVPFTVKNGTKYIGSYSLIEVYELQTVTIPPSVVFIGDYAISKEVKIRCYKDSYAHRYAVENGYVYEFIFEGAVGGICGDNLTWVYDMQSATLTISGEGEMYVYDSYKDIPWYDYKPDIRNLILNEGITTITQNAFSRLVKITEVNLPSTLKTIEFTTFYNCKSLKSVIIPDSVIYIGSDAFGECRDLGNVIIGNGIKTINMFAFARCTSLTNITFPESLEKICSQAFSGCSSLENIQLPDKAINIESDCFIGTAFFNNPDNWEDSALYSDNFLIVGNNHIQASFTVKNGTKYIGSYSLIEVFELQTVTIPQSVEFIGEFAISKEVKIRCYKNSYAHKYAIENGYTYQLID